MELIRQIFTALDENRVGEVRPIITGKVNEWLLKNARRELLRQKGPEREMTSRLIKKLKET